MHQRTITAEDLAACPAPARPTLIDVREQQEWAAGHIEGARHIPLGELVERAAEVPRGQPVVLMCRAGVRSARGIAALEALGFDNLINLVDGFDGWQRCGGQGRAPEKSPAGGRQS